MPIVIFTMNVACADACFTAVKEAFPHWESRAEIAAMIPTAVLMVAVCAILVTARL